VDILGVVVSETDKGPHRIKVSFADPESDLVAAWSLGKIPLARQTNSLQIRIADSSSTIAVSFSSARTTKRFPSPRDVRLQSRLFARWNQSLRHSPNSNLLC
jgi:hypothetical protein